MKTVFKLLIAGVLMSALCAGFASCNNTDGSELTDEQKRTEMAKLTDDVYYVAGYHSRSAVVWDDVTVKAGVYLFISENLRDTVGVYNQTKDGQPGTLFDGVFEFPKEAFAGNRCIFRPM